MAFIKEESEDVKIEETFRVKEEETEKLTEGAPTAQTQLTDAKRQIELQKQKILHLEDKLSSVTEERNYLRERLEDAIVQKRASGGAAPPAAAGIRSASESPDAADSTDSSDEPKRRRRRKMKEKRREGKKKKSETPTSDYYKRVQTPEESMRRYYRVLKLVQQGLSKTEAYSRTNVDRNTIMLQAPIAELAAANPEQFSELRQTFRKGDGVQRFAQSCLSLCKEKANEDAITTMKEANHLLDIHKKITDK